MAVKNTAKTSKCVSCGHEYPNAQNHFLKIPYSSLWANNDNYCPICVKCLNEKFEEYRKLYDEVTAVIIICHYIDVPFYYSIYDNIKKKNNTFKIGLYTRTMNGSQYKNKSFATSLIEKQDIGIDPKDYEITKEIKWSKEEQQNRDDAISIIGYDPFEGYPENDRRFLFNDLIKYFDDDIADDTFKLSMIIQIVNNNHQIWRINVLISTLDPIKDATEIKELNRQKNDLVTANDKIAKENEISVKNRSNKDVGKSTLTYLMKDLRQKNFKEAEENFYDQLRSIGSQWAIDMSNKSIKENAMFDENDKEEILQTQREIIQSIQAQLDDTEEKNRLLQIEIEKLKAAENDE